MRFVRIILMLVALPCGARAELQAVFSSQQSLQRAIVALVEGSHASIDLAVYQATSFPLLKALRRAEERGVFVRILIDGNARPARPSPAFDLFPGRVRLASTRRGRGAMHHKFAVFDGQKVLSGSYNWTPGAEHKNEENVLIVDDPAVVAGYAREFDRLWVRSAPRIFSADNRLNPVVQSGSPRRMSHVRSGSRRVQRKSHARVTVYSGR